MLQTQRSGHTPLAHTQLQKAQAGCWALCGPRVPTTPAPAGPQTHSHRCEINVPQGSVTSSCVPLSNTCTSLSGRRFPAGSQINPVPRVPALCPCHCGHWGSSWAHSHCRQHHQAYETQGVVSLPLPVYSWPLISHFPKPHHPICIQCTMPQPSVRVLLEWGLHCAPRAG